MLGFAEELFYSQDSTILARAAAQTMKGAVSPVLYSNSHHIHGITKKGSRATSPNQVATLSFMAIALSMFPSPLLAAAVTSIRYVSAALVDGQQIRLLTRTGCAAL